MQRDVKDDLAYWLKTATRGLSPAIKAQVQDELTAHYEDALEDYKAEGLSQAEACRKAVADLGDARATGRALRETHMVPRRYILAVLLSILYPFGMLWLPNEVYHATGSDLAYEVMAALTGYAPIVFVVLTLRQLIRQRTGSDRFDGPALAVTWGMVVNCAVLVLHAGIYGGSVIDVIIQGTLWAAHPLKAILAVLDIGSLTVIGLGEIVAGLFMLRLDDQLYGLRGLMACLFLADGIFASAYVVSVLIPGAGSGPAPVVFSLLTILLHTLTFMVLAFLFFRAAYRGLRLPTQAA